jgi:hypothetical protein
MTEFTLSADQPADDNGQGYFYDFFSKEHGSILLSRIQTTKQGRREDIFSNTMVKPVYIGPTRT